MSARLGEILLKVGTLTEEQLEQVLHAQSIYGGRLGTNLVEMGLVEEEELARVLSEQLGVPCAHPAELGSIPESLLKMFQLELVQRYRVLPLALDGKRLTVAMTNPSDFKALEDIAFMTGMVVLPKVCSELRLSIALERIFGVKRPMRYIPVEGGARSRFAATLAERGSADPAWDGGKVDHAWERVSLKDLSERLAQAAGESDVVQGLLAYLAGEFDRGGFLRLKGGAVHGVQAADRGAHLKGFPFFAAAVAETRELKRVVEEKRLFLGELGTNQGDGMLLRAMGGEVPGAALLVPVVLGRQVLGVVCVNDQGGRLGGGAFELQRVAVMAGLSFEMLSLRKRIMTV
ncbi:general secretion pathway protein GspE [Geoanaerobacter pelophilus]|nr:general secretion pathway protein GspE [Geoanaerobacter pelophilus]